MRVRGDDVAAQLLGVIGAEIDHTREYGDHLVHAYALPNHRERLLVGGPIEEDRPDATWWIGADVGRYPLDERTFDAVWGRRSETPRLRTFAGAERNDTIRIWAADAFDPATLSLATLQRLAAATRSAAEHARRLLTGRADNQPEQIRDVDLGMMTGLWEHDLAYGGHSPRCFPPQAFLRDPLGVEWRWGRRYAQSPVLTSWALESSPWPVDLARPSVEDARIWLEARYPPDCVHLDILDRRVLAYGALGVVAFALEDRHSVGAGILNVLDDVEAQPTLLDVASDLLAVYGKLGAQAQRHMEAREFGWLRPFTIVASSVTGRATARVWDPGDKTMVDDHAMSATCEELIEDPSSEQLRRTLLRTLEDRLHTLEARWR